MPSGMLCWSKEKGFRFIQPADGGEDVFFFVSGLKDVEGSVDEGSTANVQDCLRLACWHHLSLRQRSRVASRKLEH